MYRSIVCFTISDTALNRGQNIAQNDLGQAKSIVVANRGKPCNQMVNC